MKKKLTMIGLAIVLALSLVMVVAAPASAAVDSVTILYPTVASDGAAAQTTSGGSVEVTVSVTADAGDYVMAIAIMDSATYSTTYGSYSELVSLSEGTTVITRNVPLLPGIPATAMPGLFAGVVASVGGTDAVPVGGAADPSVMIMDIPGATLTTALIGKSVILVSSVMDQLVTPGILPSTLETGSAVDALTDNGVSVVEGIGNVIGGQEIKDLGGSAGDLASTGIDIASEVVAGVRGSVVTYVPNVVGGGLSLVSEIVTLFSTIAPLA